MPAGFVEPMLLQRTDALPSGPQWLYELKLDGYRAIAFTRHGAVHLRSRNDKDFNIRYPGVVKALQNLPDDTIIDGENVAFDEEGRLSFNAAEPRVLLGPGGLLRVRRDRTRRPRRAARAP